MTLKKKKLIVRKLFHNFSVNQHCEYFFFILGVETVGDSFSNLIIDDSSIASIYGIWIANPWLISTHHRIFEPLES